MNSLKDAEQVYGHNNVHTVKDLIRMLKTFPENAQLNGLDISYQRQLADPWMICIDKNSTKAKHVLVTVNVSFRTDFLERIQD